MKTELEYLKGPEADDEDDEKASAQQEPEGFYQNEDESSMFIAVLSDQGDIRVSPEALSTAQKTLLQLGNTSEQGHARKGRQVTPFPPITSRHAVTGNGIVSRPTR